MNFPAMRSAAAALVLGALAIAGCGGSDDDAPTAAADTKPARSIELVYTFDEIFNEPLREITADVKRRTGIDVNLVLAGESYEDADKRVQADVAAGRPPALAMVGLNRARPYVESGRAQPIDGFLRNGGFDTDQLFPAFTELLRFDGKTYGLPFAVSTPILYLNADAFRRAGLDPDRPPETWEEVEQAARRLVDARASRYGVFWAWDITGNWLFENQIESNGGQVMDGGEPTFNRPEGTEVVSYWRELVADRLMPLLPEKDGLESFIRGDTAMLVTSTAYLKTVEDSADFRLRTGLMPIPSDGERRTSAGGNGFLIMTEDPGEQRAAWEVIKAMASPRGSATVTGDTGYMPVNQLARREPTLAKALRDPNRQTSLRQVDTLDPWFNYPGRRGVQITDRIRDALFAALSGKQPPQEALDAAADQIRGLL
jgi:multiple sugar transport system substrate-binding protein